MTRSRTPAATLKRGLAGYWPLAGASAVDLKAARYETPWDFTNSGAATRAAGPSNNLRDAASFASASSQFLTLTGLHMGGTGSFSGSCWAWLADDLATIRSLAGEYETTGDQRSWWVRVDAAESLQLIINGDGTATGGVTVTFTGIQPLVVQTWYFVYWYWDGAGGRQGISANRLAPVEAAKSTFFKSTGALTIGARGSGADFHNGRVAHVGLWQRLLTATELDWLYNNGQGRSLARGV